MNVTLDLPPEVEEAYVAEAKARGVSVETLVRDLLLERQPVPAFVDLTPEEWVAEFKTWVRSHANEDLPLLPDEAISRDFIYRERGL